MPAVISIIGRKGSGKSEILEQLISLLKQRGLRIGVIKHLAREDFEIDQPEKDTYRYRTQGASKVMLSGRKRLAIFANLEEETPLQNLLVQFQEYDLVFLEGYFSDDFPKIEIHKEQTNQLQEIIHFIEDQFRQQKKGTGLNLRPVPFFGQSNL